MPVDQKGNSSIQDVLFKHHPQAFFYLEGTTIVELNASARSLFQNREDDFTDTSFLSLVIPDDQDRVRSILNEDDQGTSRKCTATLRTGPDSEVSARLLLIDPREMEDQARYVQVQPLPEQEESTESKKGEEKYDQLRETLSSLRTELDAEIAFMAEIDPGRQRGQMHVFLRDGEDRAPVPFNAEASLFEALTEGDPFVLSSEAQTEFPEDVLFRKYQIGGVGAVRTSLSLSDREHYYIYGVMDPSGLTGPETVRTVLSEYLDRVESEIEQSVFSRRTLKESGESYRILFQNNPEPMYVYDTDTLEILEVNPSAVETYGYPREEFLELTVKDMRPEEDVPKLLDFLEDADRVRRAVNVRHRKKDGSTMIMEVSSHRINFRGHPARLVIARDVTKRKNAVRKIEKLAKYDSLTSLPNRSYFEHKLSSVIEKARDEDLRIGVMYLDLDGFNRINDVLGHSVGDRLLRNLADRFSRCFPRNGMLSRWGGDEFVGYLLNFESQEELETIAQKFRQVLDTTFRIEGREFQLSGSVGISMFPRDGDESDELIAKADLAMIRAKETSDQFMAYYVEGEKEETFEELQLINDLRQSIDRKHFELHYHPLIDASAKEITGCEALIRWNHPERGLQHPGSFIPAAEASGLIVPIGQWVIKEACRQVTTWNERRDASLTISVNVAAEQLKHGDFLERIQNLLDETGADPSWLQLEVTENTLMTNIEQGQRLLKKLRALGVNVAIDDFGTGYSSLAYLMQLPVDTLKIDRSFTDRITDEPYIGDLFEMVQTMSARVGFNVVVEGVETKNQLDAVMRKNCRLLQGFLFSKPMTASDFESRIENGSLLESLS